MVEDVVFLEAAGATFLAEEAEGLAMGFAAGLVLGLAAAALRLVSAAAS